METSAIRSAWAGADSGITVTASDQASAAASADFIVVVAGLLVADATVGLWSPTQDLTGQVTWSSADAAVARTIARSKPVARRW